MEMRERILGTALRMFKTYGVKGVTMFDIARDCGISKKTVYEHFVDKQALIDEGMQQLLNNHMAYFNECLATTDNVIEESVRNMKYVTNIAKTQNPVMLYEIQKYHPDTWKSVESFKAEGILRNIRKNLERGMTEGLYRQHLHTDIVARMRQLQLEAAFDPIQYPADQFEMHTVMEQVTAHFILGIATLKGHKLANQYLQIKEDE